MPGGPTTFKFCVGKKLRIEGSATKEKLANPAEFDSEGQRCLIVGKDGNSTDLAVRRYAGLVSFTQRSRYQVCRARHLQLGPQEYCNSDLKNTEVFSAKGDSGSLVWQMTNGEARIVGQLHAGK